MKTPIRASAASIPPRQVAADWLHREEQGPLAADERERLDAWLDADPSHRTAYEEVAYVYALSDEHADRIPAQRRRHQHRESQDLDHPRAEQAEPLRGVRRDELSP